MKIYIAQLNTTVGALSSNADMIHRAYSDGVAAGADVVMVPELAVTGYPPLDLLDRDIFIDSALEVRDALVRETGKTALIFGCITRNTNWCGKPLHNSAIVAQNGRILLEQHKALLPTYDVFDELRYFEPARQVSAVEINGVRVGVSICEDFWFDDEILGTKLYCENPVDQLARQGAKIFAQHLGVAVQRREAEVALRTLLAHRAALRRAARLREPGRRQRRAAVRRLIDRDQQARRDGLLRAGVRGARGARDSRRSAVRVGPLHPRKTKRSAARSSSACATTSASAGSRMS